MYKVSYVSDGITTEYAFSFRFFQNADILVATNNAILTSGEYAVIANNTMTGGSVILASPPPNGTVIDIFRHIALSRVIDYQPTAKIDPEDLNTDFNFLLEALRDINAIDLDIVAWENTHKSVIDYLNYNKELIEDKLSGGGVLGLYNNLLSVLNGALPKLVNDYGRITDAPDIELSDDYGIL